MNYDQVGFAQNTLTNEIQTSVVYGPGRYFWGPSATVVTFPTTVIYVPFVVGGIDGGSLSVFSKSGLEFNIEVNVFVRLDISRLREMFRDFGQLYVSRIRDQVRASIKNSAPFWTVEEYVTQRESISAFFLQRLQVDAEKVYITVENLHILGIAFPSIGQGKFLSTAVQSLLNVKSTLQQEVERISKETEKQTESILANITLVTKSGIAQSNTIVASSVESASRLVTIATGAGIKKLIDAIAPNSTEARGVLYRYLTVRDSSETVKAVAGSFPPLVLNP